MSNSRRISTRYPVRELFAKWTMDISNEWLTFFFFGANRGQDMVFYNQYFGSGLTALERSCSSCRGLCIWHLQNWNKTKPIEYGRRMGCQVSKKSIVIESRLTRIIENHSLSYWSTTHRLDDLAPNSLRPRPSVTRLNVSDIQTLTVQLPIF